MTAKDMVLLVEDEEYVRASLAEVLEDAGFAVLQAANARAGLDVLAREGVQAVVTDLRMPQGDGQTLLESAQTQGIEVPILVLTGYGTVASAVAAMKAGACDFLQKPADPEQLVRLVRRAIERRRLLVEVQALRQAASGETRAITGKSEQAVALRALVARVALGSGPVLIRGESGSGKDVVAGCVHRASARAERSLVRADCGASGAGGFAAELFGERRGARAGAVERVGILAGAEGGTLVLDRVEELSAESQLLLLRLLDGGEYRVPGESTPRRADVRVLALTTTDLARRAREGTFRPELYYRLQAAAIDVPPMRERLEDVPELARALWAELAPMAETGLADDALEVLKSAAWPGNVRELRNVLERARMVAAPAVPEAALLRVMLESGLAGAPTQSPSDLNLRWNLDRTERRLLLEALERTGGVRKDAAEMLGIDARNMGYYLRKHRLADIVPKRS